MDKKNTQASTPMESQNTNAADHLPPFSEDALYEAQELAFDAWEESNRQKRIALVKKALRVSPYCTDAYNILARSTQDLSESANFYAQGVYVGTKSFGKKFFKENEGYFWEIIETRPFMRAMEGLGDCLWRQGERPKAIEIYQETLRLNPNDNQGNRYILINWLIAESMFEAAEKLLSTYPEDSTLMLYGAVLLYFKQGKMAEAKIALEKGISANPHVPEFLLNPKKKYVPKSETEKMFGTYSPGRPSEAAQYRSLSGAFWQETPGALEWLKENAS
ncbi:MAG: tetratricopeptide repeat protein [Oscillospiraceae bacterium]|jgi:tetratricopeptide (TPR) repeat protein|nr:tetratricopeptide repeat protein [Oscillospiraceae bacterium]